MTYVVKIAALTSKKNREPNHKPLELQTRMIDDTRIIVYHTVQPRTGPVAEWLCSGLQNREHRFNSGPGLQRTAAPANFILTPSGFVDFSCADNIWHKNYCNRVMFDDTPSPAQTMFVIFKHFL